MILPRAHRLFQFFYEQVLDSAAFRGIAPDKGVHRLVLKFIVIYLHVAFLYDRCRCVIRAFQSAS